MTHPVFISYARDASREHAVALHEALGEETAFLDTSDIATGDHFPERLVDSLFDAKVVVIFAEPVYFTRWYCLLEFRIARTPFLRMVERAGSTPAEREDALRSIVIAFPPRGVSPGMERFPSLVGATNWPSVQEPEKIAEMVLARLAADPPTLRERYAALGDADSARRTLLEATRLPPPMRIGSIPFVPQVGLPTTIGDAFVGRADDLWRIHDVLTTERGNLATAAGLTGSIEAGGGFGKTRLALEYLYRFGPRHYRGGLFWIDAEGDPELQLYDVLRSLTPSAPEISVVRALPGGVHGAVARAIRARSEADPPALFILDNIPEPPSGEPPHPLETWCPVLGEVPVLTTSRTRVALGSTGNIVALPIETLEPEAAVALLTTGMSRTGLEPDKWHEIAAWVGHLPLALELLNRLVRSGAMTPIALLEESRQERPSAALDKAMDALRGKVQPGALRGVTEALSASYDRLTVAEQYAARLLAWLAPEPIPEIVVAAFGPEVFTAEVRSTLRSRSFVGGVRNKDGLYFGTMHRVLADFLRSQSPDMAPEVETVISRFNASLHAANGRGDEGAQIVRGVAPSTLSLVRNLMAEGCLLDQLDSINDLGVVLGNWGQEEFAIPIFRDMTNESARHLGTEHPSTLRSMNNLALTLSARGDLAGAQTLYEQVLEANRRVLGEEHPHTLLLMNNLAATLSNRGDLAGAQTLQEQVLDARRCILGEEHPDTLVSMNNLAHVLSARGDLARAHTLYEQVLEASRRILGEEHPDTLLSMNNLAHALGARGDLAGAQTLQKQVLDARRRTLGEEHPNTLVSMNNLAHALSARGDLDGAHTLYEQVLEASRRILGEEHPQTLHSRNNVAATLSNRGDLAGAQTLQEQVLDARRRILGEDHPDTLLSMNNLAHVLSARGDLARAHTLQQQVLEASRRTLGEEHPDTLLSINNLAHVLSARGDLARAHTLYKQVLEASRRTLGVEHPATSVAAFNLSLTLEEQGTSAQQVIHDHLAWLRDRAPETLSANQVTIREWLTRRAERAPDRKPWWKFW